jgi:threonine dehydrogenase-like Zn-dependent dehydrogenase
MHSSLGICGSDVQLFAVYPFIRESLCIGALSCAWSHWRLYSGVSNGEPDNVSWLARRPSDIVNKVLGHESSGVVSKGGSLFPFSHCETEGSPSAQSR